MSSRYYYGAIRGPKVEVFYLQWFRRRQWARACHWLGLAVAVSKVFAYRIRSRKSYGCVSGGPARWRVGDGAEPATPAAVASWRIRWLLRSFDTAVHSATYQAGTVRRPQRPAFTHPPGAVYRGLLALHPAGAALCC